MYMSMTANQHSTLSMHLENSNLGIIIHRFSESNLQNVIKKAMQHIVKKNITEKVNI